MILQTRQLGYSMTLFLVKENSHWYWADCWRQLQEKEKQEPSCLGTKKVVLEVERRQWGKGLYEPTSCSHMAPTEMSTPVNAEIHIYFDVLNQDHTHFTEMSFSCNVVFFQFLWLLCPSGIQAGRDLISTLILEGHKRNLVEKAGGICEQKIRNQIILLETLGKNNFCSVNMKNRWMLYPVLV